jgi:glycosyltransferase involved in cell wall biosynthesis
MAPCFFSVIIPTYNRAYIVSRAIESVLDQTFQDFEIIVVDDGSTDQTAAVVKEFISEKIIYVSQTNAGVSAARNHGADRASGKFLLFLDSDDYLSNGSLEIYHKALSEDNFLLLLGYCMFENAKGKIENKIMPWKSGDSFSHPLTGSFVIQKTLFKKLGGYDEKLFYSETSDLFLRLRMDKKIQMTEVRVVKNAGVHIAVVDRQMRKLHYSEKKYRSVKYFLEKHRGFFESSTKDFVNFKRLHAFSALQNSKYDDAAGRLKEIVVRTPYSVKARLHYYFVLFFPRLAKFYYGR